MFRTAKKMSRPDAVHSLTREDFLWAIGSLCQVNRVPFDAALISGQSPGPFTTLTLTDAASRLGLKCALHEQEAARCESWAFPCIAMMKSAVRGDDEDDEAPPPPAVSPSKAIVTLSRQSLRTGETEWPISPGMQVVAELKEGERTVMEYLLSPVRKTVGEAGRER